MCIGVGVAFRRVVRPACVNVRNIVVRRLEHHHGIRTFGERELTELGIAAPDRVDYKAAPWLALRRALPPRSVTGSDVFLDLGSGMGRVVFLAALRYPFKRVIGVEVSRDLHNIAEDNIARNRSRFASRKVELICADVLEYAVPDDVTVVFLYNPFTGRVFQTVVERLVESVDRAPRPLRIIYSNPAEHERLVGTGRIRLVKRVRGMRPGSDWSRSKATHVYEVLSHGR